MRILSIFCLILASPVFSGLVRRERHDPLAITCREDPDGITTLQDRLRTYLLGRNELTLPNNEPPVTYQTYTSLCAAYPYGGFARSSLGGWCDRHHPQGPMLDYAVDVGDYRLFTNSFLRGLCTLRCLCSLQPNEYLTPQVATSRPGGFMSNANSITSLRNYDWVESTPFLPQTVRFAGTSLTPGDSGAIHCTSAPPQDVVPGSIRRVLNLPPVGALMPNTKSPAAYQNYTALCASAAFGGLPDSNMGGVCLPISLFRTRVVFWGLGRNLRWGNGDPRIRLIPALQTLCRSRCECVTLNSRSDMKPADPIGPVTTEEEVLHTRAVLLGRLDSSSTPGSSGAGWRPRVGLTSGFRPYQRCALSQSCGLEQGWKCSGGCACLASEVRKGTFKPMGCGRQEGLTTTERGWLGGRSIDIGDPGAETGRWGCPCNASYVSRGCCGADEGMVWEGMEFKMGILAKG
ncbi:MAG: hypothetical protein M1814_003504 [Vezdaea aestivalis]|nr:MAG: hypothetical protein M1814_003504 [Vezdaea aestivalis]